MISIKITPRKDARRSDGSVPLYATFYTNKTRIRLHLGINISLDSWDEKNQAVKPSEPNADDINLLINDFRSRITDVFVRARLQDITLTKERFFTGSYRVFGCV